MKKILLLLLMLIAKFSFSQQYRYVTSESTDNNVNHRYFRGSGGKYYELSYPNFHVHKLQLNSYDSGMRQISSKEIKEFNGSWLFESLCFNNKLLLFFGTLDDAYYAILNPETGSIEKKQSVFMYDKCWEGITYSGYSQDSSKLFFVYKDDYSKNPDEYLYYLIFDRQGNLLSKGSFAPHVAKTHFQEAQFQVSNDGFIVINYIANSDASFKSKDYTSRLGYFVSDGKTTFSGLLPGTEAMHSNFVTDLRGNKINFTVFTGKSFSDGVDKLRYGSFDLVQKKLLSEKETKLSEHKAFQTFHTIDVGCIPRQIFYNKDGSKLVMCELRGSYSNIARGGSFYFTCSAATLYKINSNNDIEWLYIIGKSQEQQLAQFIQSVAAIDNKGGIYLFFHGTPDWKTKLFNTSNVKNYSLLAAYVTSDGKMSGKVVVNNGDYEQYFSPTTSYPVANNELMFTAIKNRQLGKETYRPGILRIE